MLRKFSRRFEIVIILGICFFLLLFNILFTQAQATETAEAPISEIVSDTPTPLPTNTQVATTVSPTVTPLPPSATLPATDTAIPASASPAPSSASTSEVASTEAATLSVTAPPSATLNIGTAASATIESSLTPIYTTNFNAGDTSAWHLGAGWSLVPSGSVQALQVSNSEESADLITDVPANLVIEVHFNLTVGGIRLSLDETDAGAYHVTLDTTGLLQLWRDEQSLVSTRINSDSFVGQHVLKVTVQDGMFQIVVDDADELIFQDTSPLPAGTISLNAIFPAQSDPTQNILQVDDLSIWAPATTQATPTQIVLGTLPPPPSNQAPTEIILATLPLPPTDTPTPIILATLPPPLSAPVTEETVETTEIASSTPVVNSTVVTSTEAVAATETTVSASEEAVLPTVEVTEETAEENSAPASTPEVTESITEQVAATATVEALPEEPPLALLFSDNFDLAATVLWTLGPNWSFVSSGNGQALQVSTDDDVTTFLYGGLYNVAAEARFQFTAGSSRLHIRRSDAGEYTAALNTNGEVDLYRGDVLLATTTISTSGDWHELRLSAFDDVIRVSVDDHVVISLRDATPLPAGFVGFSGHNLNGTAMQVDDFALWLPAQDINVTPQVTPEVTSEVTPAATLQVLPPEPNLTLLLQDNFDNGDLSQWTVGNGWGLASADSLPAQSPTDAIAEATLSPDMTEAVSDNSTPEATASPSSGQVLRVSTNATPLTLNYDPLQDTVAQVDVFVASGAVQVNLRQNSTDNYSVKLDAAGNVDLYRSGTSVGTATIASPVGHWHTLRFATLGGAIRISIDGQDIITYIDDNPLSAGSISIEALSSDATNSVSSAPDIAIDNFMLWVPTADLSTPVPEPELSVLYSDNFDNGDLVDWMQNTDWTLGFSTNSLAVEARTNSQARFIENNLDDVVIEASTQIKQGAVELRTRETGGGAYRASFDASGRVDLYRGDVLLQTVETKPFGDWEYRTIRLSTIKNTIRVSENGTELMVVVDKDPLPIGQLSLNAVFTQQSPDAIVRVDSVSISTPIAAKQITAQVPSIAHPQAARFGLSPMVTSLSCSPPNQAIPVPAVGEIAYTNWCDSTIREEIYLRSSSATDQDDGVKIIGNSGTAEVQPAISPDGTRVVFASDYAANGDGIYTLYMVDLRNLYTYDDKGNVTGNRMNELPFTPNNADSALKWIPLTTGGNDLWPVWSPDGTRIAFQSNRDGQWRIYTMDAIDTDGNGIGDNLAPLTADSLNVGEYYPAWSPDGREIAYTASGCNSQDYDIFEENVYGPKATTCSTIQRLVTSPGTDNQPAWSPDGRYLTFTSYRQIHPDIYLKRVDNTNLTIHYPDPEGIVTGSEISLTDDTNYSDSENTMSTWAPDWLEDEGNRSLSTAHIAFLSTDDDENELYFQRMHILDIAFDESTLSTSKNITVNVDNLDTWKDDPKTPAGKWTIIAGARPDWSQRLVCTAPYDWTDSSDKNQIATQKAAADARILGLNGQVTPTPTAFSASLQKNCLWDYRGLAFAAYYNETSEDNFISMDRLASQVEFTAVNVPNVRYLYARVAVNGVLNMVSYYNFGGIKSASGYGKAYFTGNYTGSIGKYIWPFTVDSTPPKNANDALADWANLEVERQYYDEPLDGHEIDDAVRASYSDYMPYFMMAVHDVVFPDPSDPGPGTLSKDAPLHPISDFSHDPFARLIYAKAVEVCPSGETATSTDANQNTQVICKVVRTKIQTPAGPSILPSVCQTLLGSYQQHLDFFYNSHYIGGGPGRYIQVLWAQPSASQPNVYLYYWTALSFEEPEAWYSWDPFYQASQQARWAGSEDGLTIDNRPHQGEPQAADLQCNQ